LQPVTFTLLPAVDVADGLAIRLGTAVPDGETTLIDPAETALAWQSGGAQWIHLADLDAAFGRGSNAELLASVIGRLDVKVQLSGGIRDDASLGRALSTGCARVVLGTAALRDPAWCARAISTHGERIAIGLDVRVDESSDGTKRCRLAARGETGVGGDLWSALNRLDRDGCARYVVTDVSRDGMLAGPNIDLYRAIADATTTPVIASGGVSRIADLVALAKARMVGVNLDGAIVGTALHAGRFTLAEALEAMRRVEADRPPASAQDGA
jgi:phosphoribosyl isomerase A